MHAHAYVHSGVDCNLCVRACACLRACVCLRCCVCECTHMGCVFYVWKWQGEGTGGGWVCPQEAAVRIIQQQFRKSRKNLKLWRRSFTKFGAEARNLVRRYLESPASAYEQPFACRARLILHFDINKTIIMTDKAQVPC